MFTDELEKLKINTVANEREDNYDLSPLFRIQSTKLNRICKFAEYLGLQENMSARTMKRLE